VNGPFITVLEYKVSRHPTMDVVLAVFIHHGQIFNLCFDAGTALALAGDLEAAYQAGTEEGHALVSRVTTSPAAEAQAGTEGAGEAHPASAFESKIENPKSKINPGVTS
jgi:hypothetical protein